MFVGFKVLTSVVLFSTATEVFYFSNTFVTLFICMHIISAKSFPAPKKIISLVPSQTELLYHLGLQDEVVGITKFCIHPMEWFKNKKKVGGTKTVNIEFVHQLKPDIIIANKEENEKEQVEILMKDFNVWVTDVCNLKDALAMMNDIGHLTNTANAAKQLIAKIKKEFMLLKNSILKIPAAYLIWQKPYMTIGGDTFISDMMDYCGLKNIFSDKKRYPEITLEELQFANCQLVLLSSEPYPFKQKHVDELQQFLREKKILLVNGEMFSWYGSRLLKTPSYFKKLITEF